VLTYHDKQLKQEIHAVLDGLTARREPWEPQWVTQEICEAHRAGLVNNDAAAFWDYAGYTLTRKVVTECINERADPPGGGEGALQQLSLPGFARMHLHDYYVVTREDRAIAVCVLDLTDDEIDAKAALYRSQARKAIAHAEELERFKDWRLHGAMRYSDGLKSGHDAAVNRVAPLTRPPE
jgi:hypothetical protein